MKLERFVVKTKLPLRGVDDRTAELLKQSEKSSIETAFIQKMKEIVMGYVRQYESEWSLTEPPTITTEIDIEIAFNDRSAG